MSAVDLSYLLEHADHDEMDEPGDPDQFPDLPVIDYDAIPDDQGDGSQHARRLLIPPEEMALGASVSGLSAAHRAEVRRHVKQALDLSYAHGSLIGYSQGADRWEGIAHHLYASRGAFPHHCDCSSWGSWVLYQGLRVYHVRDLVNDQRWQAGYTGTMVVHGKLVVHERNIKLGDLAIYGASRSDTRHVAVCIGGGFVLSHGSPGVHKLDLYYRGDLLCVRRYI